MEMLLQAWVTLTFLSKVETFLHRVYLLNKQQQQKPYSDIHLMKVAYTENNG